MILFLDLEGTVIDTFENMNLGNISEVRSFIKSHNPESIFIYSFAIWDKKDVSLVKNLVIPRLEDVLNCTISKKVITVSNMRQVLAENEGLILDHDFEFINILGKYYSFLRLAPLLFPNKDVTLIDDMVPDSTTHNKTLNIRLETIIIDTLIKQFKKNPLS